MKHEFTEKQISETMKKYSITRKSAIRRLKNEAGFGTKSAPAQRVASTPNPVVATLPATPAMTALPDVKMRAANDNTVAPVTPAPAKAKAAPAPKVATAAGSARAEGIRLFQLAGKPKKDDFIHVYGPQGAKWTWVARAKAVGLATAEEAAAQFSGDASETRWLLLGAREEGRGEEVVLTTDPALNP